MTALLAPCRSNPTARRAPLTFRGLYALALLLSGASCTFAQSDEPERVPAAIPTRASRAQRKHDGSDWPQFLGPMENGISSETGLKTEWPVTGPPLVWKAELGTGYAAPSVRGDRLVVHHRRGNSEIVECLEAANGNSLWSYVSTSHFSDPYGYNNGPRCTPLLTDDLCFTLGAEGRLSCLNLLDGTLIWERKLKEEFEIPEGFFGVAATPILEGNKLIVLVGGQPNSGVVAFDKASGKTLWQSVGQDTWDGASTGWAAEPIYDWTGEEMVVSYSSPMAATIHGHRMILCLMRQGLVALNPDNGEEYFHHWFSSRAYESVNAARPVVVDDTILLGAAYRVGSECLRVFPSGKEIETVWKDPRTLSTHWSTAIFHDGCYFGFSGRHENEAVLQCVDAKTGDVRWETPGNTELDKIARGPNGSLIDKDSGEPVPWPLYGRGSAILMNGDTLAILGERGTLAFVKAQPDQWEEISRSLVPGMENTRTSWTAPVLSRGLLYLRAELSSGEVNVLVCVDLADSQPAGEESSKD